MFRWRRPLRAGHSSRGNRGAAASRGGLGPGRPFIRPIIRVGDGTGSGRGGQGRGPRGLGGARRSVRRDDRSHRSSLPADARRRGRASADNLAASGGEHPPGRAARKSRWVASHHRPQGEPATPEEGREVPLRRRSESWSTCLTSICRTPTPARSRENETLWSRPLGRHLKPRCQELLSLLVADDPLGYKHLSDLLQMPIGSIGPTRARCLEHLRRLIEEQGLTAA